MAVDIVAVYLMLNGTTDLDELLNSKSNTMGKHMSTNDKRTCCFYLRIGFEMYLCTSIVRWSVHSRNFTPNSSVNYHVTIYNGGLLCRLWIVAGVIIDVRWMAVFSGPHSLEPRKTHIATTRNSTLLHTFQWFLLYIWSRVRRTRHTARIHSVVLRKIIVQRPDWKQRAQWKFQFIFWTCESGWVLSTLF